MDSVLENNHIDALLVTNFYNILYTTGFEGLAKDEREAYVVITKKGTILLTDGRYVGESKVIKSLKSNVEIRIVSSEKRLLQHLEEIAGEENIKKIGFESEDLKFQEYEFYKDRLPGVVWVPVDRQLAIQRAVKREDEISKIRKACEIGDACFNDMVKIIRPGITEKEIVFKMEFWLKERGYAFAFDPIVAVDANSAVAHYNTRRGEGKVGEDSVVLIDFGVKYENYNSDITRMIFVGNTSDEMRRAYSVLKTVQEKAVESLNRVSEYSVIDREIREELKKSSLPDYSHSTGHGIGLEVHEYPKIWHGSADIKKPGHVVTVEPGIYVPGKWGMRIEDTVVIGADGNAEALTRAGK